MSERQDLGRWLQDWAARGAAEQARFARRYGEFLQRLGRGDLLQPAGRDAYWRFVRDEPNRYIRGLAVLSLDYYRALFELARASSDRFFDEVLGLAGAREGHEVEERRATAVGPPQRVELHLRAPLGGEATGSFVVQNKRGQDAEIFFLASHFSGPEGREPFRPPLVFEPARFALQPGEDRVVVVRLPLDPQYFLPDQRYRATVVVHGQDSLELGLDVLVTAAPAGTGDTPAPGAARGPASSPRRRARRRSRS